VVGFGSGGAVRALVGWALLVVALQRPGALVVTTAGLGLTGWSLRNTGPAGPTGRVPRESLSIGDLPLWRTPVTVDGSTRIWMFPSELRRLREALQTTAPAGPTAE
jgi:hypothetical protein